MTFPRIHTAADASGMSLHAEMQRAIRSLEQLEATILDPLAGKEVPHPNRVEGAISSLHTELVKLKIHITRG
ncbi:MAG: hypothetical protein HYX27_17920 [Acidobacteria bacterium]|nr:hypothetical protein [Acidobacteriota bacterium]